MIASIFPYPLETWLDHCNHYLLFMIVDARSNLNG